MACTIGLLLAYTSVVRTPIARSLRVDAFLYSGCRPLRMTQAGHPGDYALGLTIGFATFGMAA